MSAAPPPVPREGKGEPPHAELMPRHGPAVNALDKACVALATGVLVVDLLIGMFCFTFMLCPFLAIVAVVRLLTAQTTQRPAKWTVVALVSGLAAPALAIAALLANAAHAKAQAHDVVAAVEAFHHHEGRWPKTLDETVPQYMRSVPHARLALSMSEFDYMVSQESGPHLTWVVLPPFGRQYYVFEQKRWGSLD